MSQAKRVLVIGAAGLVGRHVLRALGERGQAAFHRDPISAAPALDVRDARAVLRVLDEVRPNAVVLAAAEPYVERCESEPLETRRVNVEGTLHVRRAANAHGAVLVVLSSEYVFDGRAGRYSEDDLVAPLNEYGRQKMEIEAIARTGQHLICRTSGVFGPEPTRKNFVLQLVDRLRAGKTFVVPSDQLITPTYAPSLASAIVELIDHGATGTYHVCGPRVLPRVEFAEMVVSAFELPRDGIEARSTAEIGLVAPRPLRAGLDDTKLRRTLGHALTDPADALRQLAAEDG